ncbi:MAG: class I SAM-dependent methyltransferase [Chloroflexi bacterium]|nr:class I SAM-dependent methyltransferase [Chloroflexota bacterium]
MPIKYSARLGALDTWKNDLAMSVRRRVFRQFWRIMQPTPNLRVADFGVSGHRDHPAHYFFESLYPWKDRLTAIGQAAEDASWFPEQFPGLTFLEADLRSIPVPDNHFDIGICNAVVEHAGVYEQQVALVREVCRVARKVMFTTPNKDFPVEVHTFVPLAHWLPGEQFYAVLKAIGQNELASVEQLNPLDEKTFLSLFPNSRDTTMVQAGLPLLRTNLVCVSTARDA